MSAWDSTGSTWSAEEVERWQKEQQPTQSGGDPWQSKDPWGGKRPASEPAAQAPELAAQAAAEDFSAHDGVYRDEWADAECTLSFVPGKVLCRWASAPDDPPDEGPCEKGVINLYKLTGELKDGEVKWSHGGRWVKKETQVAAAPTDDQPRWEGTSWEQRRPGATPATGSAAAPAEQDQRWGGGSWGERPSESAPPAAEEQRWDHSNWDQQPSELAPAAGDTWAQPTVDNIAAGTAAASTEATQDHQRSAEPYTAGATSDPWAPDGGAEAQPAWNNYSTTAGAARVETIGEVPAAGAQDGDRSAQHRARWKDFTAFQDWYIKEGTLPGKSEAERSADEARLFQAVGGEGIDFSLYDGVPCEISGPKHEHLPSNISSFEDFFREFAEYIPRSLADNVRRCGYKQPTPVQKHAIAPAVVGRDIMCCAQTGSGKTAAFLLPTLSGLMKHGRAVGALQAPFRGPCKPDTLIMSPTRELCVQIFTEAEKFFHNTDHRAIRIYGQDSIRNQIEQVAKGADLIVATPGRLYDFVDARIIDVTEVHCLVLDEADRMLQMQQDSFMREIVEKYGMPDKENRQTMMFSATFPEACQKMAEDYLFEHLFISVGVVGGATQTVTQTLLQVAPEDKYDTLIEFIDDFLNKREHGERLLVFTNSKQQAKGLDEKLYEKHIDTGALHGDLPQQDRETNLEKFRKGEIDVMIATDVASRGLDISGVSQVLNYDLPFSIDVYVQRIGRTGRIGHRGVATTFVAVGRDGQWHDSSNEQQDTLRAIPLIMRDAGKQDVPKWLEDKIVELDASKDAWNSRSIRTDARPAWQEAVAPQDPATNTWPTDQNSWEGNWADKKPTL